MTPLYLDSQEAVDRHNERVKVQREAVEIYRRWRRGSGVDPLPEMDELFPFAQLRPSGFVGGSGRRYELRGNIYTIGFPSGSLTDVSICIPASDRAAASAALTGMVSVWGEAIPRVVARLKCFWEEALRDHAPEIIAEAQAILDREGGK